VIDAHGTEGPEAVLGREFLGISCHMYANAINFFKLNTHAYFVDRLIQLCNEIQFDLRYLQADNFSTRSPRLGQMSLSWQQGLAHNILHGSIESAIPENPLVGPNISGLSAIQAEL